MIANTKHVHLEIFDEATDMWLVYEVVAWGDDGDDLGHPYIVVPDSVALVDGVNWLEKKRTRGCLREVEDCG